ncbi:MAG: hypothetical protein A2096_09185 [Spirochaetes bacterium GWF1_41_5]|nr:MAG: hypothetical protein A2096_09185 [Spirochaetes bacterium GWF1_41_5]HBE03105.1 hypothetical protein [Spirochaetia bacterium]
MISLAGCLFPQEDYSSLFNESNTSTADSAGARNDTDQHNSTGVLGFRLGLAGDHIAGFPLPLTRHNFNFTGEIRTPRFNNEMGIEVINNNLKIVSRWALDLYLSTNFSIKNIKPLENFISWSPWKIKTGAGYQLFSWGCADGQNVIDTLNPRDYRLGLDAEKLPVLAAALNIYPADFFSAEAVYIPSAGADKNPYNIEDELPAELFYRQQVSELNLKLTAEIDYSIIPVINQINPLSINIKKTEISVNSAAKNIILPKNIRYDLPAFPQETYTAGSRLNFYTPAADFSFTYINKPDPFYTPVIRMEKYEIALPADLKNQAIDKAVDECSSIPATEVYGTGRTLKDIVKEQMRNTNFTPHYAFRVDELVLMQKRLDVVGIDIKANIDRFSFWLETAYTITADKRMTDYKTRNHNLGWVLGSDFNYGRNDDFYFNFQYTGRWIPYFYRSFYKDYPDAGPDTNKIDDEKYMEEFYYKALTDKIGGYSEGLLHGFILKNDWKFFDALLTASLQLVYTIPYLYDKSEKTRYGSAVIFPEIDIMPCDSFHIFIGAQMYYSWSKWKGDARSRHDTGDRIGRFFEDSIAYLKIQYQWSHDLKK